MSQTEKASENFNLKIDEKDSSRMYPGTKEEDFVLVDDVFDYTTHFVDNQTTE